MSANFIPEKQDFKHICLLHMQRLTNFPYIEADFDAVTNYELLCKVVEYLNKVIENENLQNTEINDLYNAFVSLQSYVNNYFDNLDVQEEINNKLDQMVESGELEQIIEQYINSTATFNFNSVEDLKGATNLIAGSFANLIGEEQANDGANQLFKIVEATGGEIDSQNDCFILDNGLIAKRVKEKSVLELSPNITSGEIIKNLKVVNSDTGAGTAGIALDGQNNTTIKNCDITGGYWSVRIGNENDNNNTTGVKLINNKLTSNYGVSLRHKYTQTAGGEHDVILNEINNNANHPGVESWAKDVRVLFNRIKNISGSVGGTGGITLGGKNNQMAIGNYIENYGYGLEIGNSNLDMANNCFIKNCSQGIVCSSDNTHDVLIDNCIVQIPENGYGIYLRTGSRITINNSIIIYGNDVGDYNTASSRSGRGLYSDTYNKNIILNNCTFINIARVDLPHGTIVNNCRFINCSAVNLSGKVIINNSLFKDVNNVAITGGVQRQYFNNCTFEKSNDNTTMNTYVVNAGAGTTRGIAEFNECQAINCYYNAMVSNADAGGRDIRFLTQKIDGIYHTFNSGQLSQLITSVEALSQTLKAGDRIIDDYANRTWEILPQGKQISYQRELPSAGAFKVGDRIYNNLNTTHVVDYWICTTAGTFGTETVPVFTAHNI